MIKMKKERKINKTVLLGLFIWLIIVFFVAQYIVNHTIEECSKKCSLVVCDYTVTNVSNGAISLKFLIDKARDWQEVYNFCKLKHFDGGFYDGRSFKVVCYKTEKNREIYHKYSIIKDFAEYLYEKYRGDKNE